MLSAEQYFNRTFIAMRCTVSECRDRSRQIHFDFNDEYNAPQTAPLAEIYLRIL